MKLLLSILISIMASSATPCTLQIDLTGPIGAGTTDYLARAEKNALENKCESILMLVNTPGGSLQSTRILVEQIVNSKLPYLCLVYPAGAHAGSAGAIILQACHVTGAVEATNIGAATPIMGTGEDVKGDLRNKMVNDTVSWLEGLTELRGRNKKFSREIVTKAEAVSARQAKEMGAIDLLAATPGDFLKQANGRKVKMPESVVIEVKTGELREFKKDMRTNFLDFLANPQIAYLLFMGSLALLYFEITHPGTLVPGVLGGLGLILSLISFHILDVHWGGLALMLVGLGLLIAEAFVPSFGILGLGGIAAFIFGGILLFDPEVTGMALSLKLVIPTAIGVGGLMLLIAYFAAKTFRVHRTAGADLLLQSEATVSFVEGDGHRGQVEVKGELWSFESPEALKVGDRVVVKNVEGLKVKVQKMEA